MHIQLVTGAIGSGKTAQVVSWIKFDPGYVDRMVYHHSISWAPGHDPGVRVYCDSHSCLVCPEDPGRESGLKAKDWHLWAEPNSVLMFDECQFIWPRRDHKIATPSGVDALTRLRHMKISMFMMTPHPMKLDVDARRAATIHHHFSKTGLGRKAKTFDEAQDDPANGYAPESKFDPIPKKVFGMYVSSEAGHTNVKRKLPRKLVMLTSFIVILTAGISSWLFSSGSPLDASGRLSLVSQAATTTVDPVPSSEPVVTNSLQESGANFGVRVSGGDGGGGSSPMLTRPDYENLLNAQPVLPGYPETAPMYTHLANDLRPDEIPRLSGCIRASKQKRCSCYDQKGKKYHTTLDRCEAFFDGRDRGFIPRMDLITQ